MAGDPSDDLTPAAAPVRVYRTSEGKRRRAREKRERDKQDPEKVKAKRDYIAKYREDNADRIKELADQRYARDARKNALATRGLTQEDYDRLLLQQNGACAICSGPPTGGGPGGQLSVFCVDHDHKTGRVRGLLCSKCNIGIGSLRDDPAILRTAADYLDRHRG